MHNDRVDARLLQQNHVAGKLARNIFVAHGMAAVFHDDRGLVVTQHVRQRLHEDCCLLLRSALELVGHIELAAVRNPPALYRGLGAVETGRLMRNENIRGFGSSYAPGGRCSSSKRAMAARKSRNTVAVAAGCGRLTAG